MTHPDAPSGQPYAPPPWDPNRLPPPSPPPGGDGGGGRKKHRKWPWILGGVFALIVVVGVAAGNSSDTAPKVALPTATPAPYPTLPPEQKAANAKASTVPKAPPAPTAAPTLTAVPPITTKPKPAPPPLTTAQAQAIGAAKDYLSFDHFSRTALIHQLEFDKYTRTDATYAVDHIAVNWNEQAAGAAKDYLSFDHFSRTGLIEQLMFDGFTRAQAVYAAGKVGL